ncbi:virulence RhuM family protein [Desulfosarcina sp. OttesenSCG-928-A07]|nr:virulence RhuM family protein [Desulfosarcina sp. OttesenSCG-928-G17]MDL2328988.1 virulence RhuM family protein [Desulfosarcina sp. OttesenSCG-928-A07]
MDRFAPSIRRCIGLAKGFALNDERFKSGHAMNYFSELQARIREIRLSERFFCCFVWVTGGVG